MQTDNLSQNGQTGYPDGLLAGQVLEAGRNQYELENLLKLTVVESEAELRSHALRGLAMAAPLSLAIWMALGALLRAVAR